MLLTSNGTISLARALTQLRPGRAPKINSLNAIAYCTNSLLPGAGFLRALEEVIHQLGAGVPHFDVKGFDTSREIVIHPDRGNSDEQTHGGGYQRFRNTASDGAQSGRFLGRDALERVDDADYRSEQSHEGAGRTNGGEARDAALQLGVNDSLGAFESALGGFNFFAGNIGA